MIALARIDDRLIHGQVVVGWVNAVKVTHIVVVEDGVAVDEVQQSFMRMAVPPHLKVLFMTVAGASEKLKGNGMPKDRLLLLFTNPEDAATLVKNGVALKEVNVGGMRFARGKREVLKSVFVDQKDILAFRSLSALGVALIGKMVPTDPPVDVMRVLGESGH